MTRKPYTDEQKREALDLFVEVGPSEASKRTGIPKSSLVYWAKKLGLRTERNQKTLAATEAAQLDAAQKRAALRQKLLDKAYDLLERMDKPHKEFKGKNADEVMYDIAPADAVRNYATSVGILIDKLRLESGEATERKEVLTGDVDSIDSQLQRLAERLKENDPPADLLGEEEGSVALPSEG